MSLFWTRALLLAMGDKLFGLFLSFQAVATLGGLGDLGMGGAVGLRTSQNIGSGRFSELSEFLAVARLVFLALAGSLVTSFLVLSPWLPHWLGFRPIPGSGDLSALFALAGVAISIVVLTSYVSNLNYATLTITWPSIPFFILGQAAFALHWIAASARQPLWVQYSAYIITAAAALFVGCCFLQWATPELAHLLPLRWKWNHVRNLAGQSMWAYFGSLGYTIYITSDRILINAGFGPEYVTPYQLNYKLCELSVFVVTSIGFVSIPKLAQWLASPATAEQERARSEAQRMNSIQTFLGIVFAALYLALNDQIVRIWVGERMWAPLALQIAFAANLAIGSGCDAGAALSSRLGDSGLRFVGVSSGITGLLNLGLSFCAMKYHWILGIALATVLAQSAQSLAAGAFATQRLGLNHRHWVTRSWIIPVISVATFGLLRWWIVPRSLDSYALLFIADFGVFAIAGWMLGLRSNQFTEEYRILRRIVWP